METKPALRRRILGARAALGPAARAAAESATAAALAPVLERSERVAAYVSVGDEPATRNLLRPGWLLPVLLAGGDLDWSAYDGRLKPGPRGLLQPPGHRLGVAAVAGCDLVLVPALAVDRAGNRLGRGGGSYDRALLRARGRTVALLHDGELLATVPAQEHDIPVAAAVTPGGGLVELGQ